MFDSLRPLRLAFAISLFALTLSHCACPDPECAVDSDCTTGVCAAGTCAPTDAGPADGGPGTAEIGEPCTDDAACSSGICYAMVCAECAIAGDCGTDEVCTDGSCTDAGECAGQALCGAGGVCCPDDGECRNGTCQAPCGTVRCGDNQEQCCADGELCYGGGCLLPGPECLVPADCADDEICEPDLGVCVPEDVVGSCTYVPPTGVFAPEVDCRWQPGPGDPDANRNDIVMAPVVGNLSDDNGDGVTDRFDVPEVIFITYDYEGDGCCNQPGTIRVVSGACNADGTMNTHASINTPALDNSGGLAIGDLDGDGVMEIVAPTLLDDGTGTLRPRGTVAFKRDADDASSWSVLWENPNYPEYDIHTRGGTQPALAILTPTGQPEVIVGNVVLDGRTGALIFDGVVTGAGDGGIGNNAFLGPVSVAVDLDLDGEAEVIAGNSAYAADGTVKWTYTYTTQGSPCGGVLPCDGYAAAANFDDDPEGEVVVVRQGEVFIFEHDGMLKRRVPIPVDDCANNESGPPTVADFDGDGRAEVGTAAGDFYVVVDLDCTDPLPEECLQTGVLWATPNEDCTSRVTASSVFDFEGDGAAEVIYADETTFRILRGTDGAELYVDDTHGSHTRLEMPVIADVDNDGNAEVVIAENAWGGGTPGVEIWADTLDNWVFTRRIWNQHSYHVTNVSESGTIAAPSERNWQQPSLNNFRQNTQGDGVFFAPDLTVVIEQATCFTDTINIRVRVQNEGSRLVGPGLNIALFDARDDGDVLLEVLTTSTLLFPGSSEVIETTAAAAAMTFSLYALVDDDGMGGGAHNECKEDNNRGDKNGGCVPPGG